MTSDTLQGMIRRDHHQPTTSYISNAATAKRTRTMSAALSLAPLRRVFIAMEPGNRPPISISILILALLLIFAPFDKFDIFDIGVLDGT